MFSVLLVDDEVASLRYLRNLITSFSPSFEVAAECENGRDALSVLHERPVDVLITDVKMPIMDGIALAKEARSLYSDLHIIIVSGYAEFEYAKSALEVAAEDYLLKPLSIDQALKVLQAVEQKLERRGNEAKLAALNSLITSGKMDEKGARLLGDTTLFLAIVRYGNLSPVTLSQHERFQARGQVKGGPGQIWVLQGRDPSEFIVLAEKELLGAEDVLAATEGKDRGSSYTMVIQKNYCQLRHVRMCVEQMARYLDEKLILGKTRVFFVPPYERQTYTGFAKSELLKLDFSIAGGDDRQVKGTLLNWALLWEDREMPQRWVELAINSIVQRALELFQHEVVNHLQIFDEINRLYASAQSAEHLMLGVWDIVFNPYIEAKTKRRSSEDVYRQLVSFIKDNYPDDLTIDSVCSVFGISQTYLSRLFRTYGQTTFNEYLTNCRISNAKHLIEQNPEIKLSDVAFLVGYDSPSYFGKVFRSSEGLTPSIWYERRRGERLGGSYANYRIILRLYGKPRGLRFCQTAAGLDCGSWRTQSKTKCLSTAGSTG